MPPAQRSREHITFASYPLNMKSTGSTLITILGVIVAVVIAWWLVGVIFSVVWFVVRLIIVAIVAVLVYFALRGLLARSSSE